MVTDIETARLSCIEINPTIPPKGSVIWLHGLGADGNDFVPIVEQLHLTAALPLRFIFPNAPVMPVTINNGYVMPAWYDIVSMNIHERADREGILTSIQQIHRLIEHEIQVGIPANKIVLAGFSQGAVVALTSGLSFPQRLAGILALSGYLPHAETFLAEKQAANQDTPIFLGHGTDDTVVPVFLGHAAFTALEKQAHPASWHTYAMAHSVCDKEVRDIAAWLQTIY
jgi:phospholipase/carboxylesterase